MLTTFSPLRQFFVTPRGKAASTPPWAALFFLSCVLFAARVLYLAFLTPYGLAPDEAQYWTWLREPSLSYLTKPPLTTWLMGLSTSLFGPTLIGVKFFALISQVVVPVLGFALAFQVAKQQQAKRPLLAGWWAWGLLTTVPLVAAGGLLMGPDAILLPLWLAAVLCLVLALPAAKPNAALWLTAGGLIGLACLAKYSAMLFVPLAFGALLLTRPGWLWPKPANWSIFAASKLVALAAVPILVWNYQHHWVGVAHVLWQTDGGGDTRHGGLNTLLEFLGGQALVVGPILFGILLWAWYAWTRQLTPQVLNPKQRRNLPAQAGLLVLLVFTLPMFLGFSLLNFHGKVQANWPLLATVPALVLVAVWLSSGASWRRWLGVAALVLNLTLSTMLMDTHQFRQWGLLPLAPKNDPTKDLRGWPQLGEVLGWLLNQTYQPVILSSRYQTLAPLMFHTPGGPQGTLAFAYLNAENRRPTHYDLWPLGGAQWAALENRLVVYVNEAGQLPAGIARRFKECRVWHTLAVEDGGYEWRRLKLWLCYGYQAASAPAPIVHGE